MHTRLCSVSVTMCLALVGAGAGEPLGPVRVLNDRAPDCSSLQSIVRTVTRNCRTDDERAIALYNFCRYVYYHHAYPNEPGGISALKMIHVYGWSLCGGEHTVLAALWEAAGFKYRYRGWSHPGHTTVEVFYGGRWHYLDTFLKFYCWMPEPNFPDGRTIAGQEDIAAHPEWITDGLALDSERRVYRHRDNQFDFYGERLNWQAPAFLVCGDAPAGLLSGVRSSRVAGSPRRWNAICFDDPSYSTAVTLTPGCTLTLGWDRVEDGFFFGGRKQGPHHTCGDKDYRNCPVIGPLLEPYRALGQARSWSNGELAFAPDLSVPGCQDALQRADNVTWADGALRPRDPARPARFEIALASPYVIVRTDAQFGEARPDLRLSTGDGWQTVTPDHLSTAVRGKYHFRLAVTFREPLREASVVCLVQHNQEALPYLAPGKNHITVSVGAGTALRRHRLAVTYAYCLGWREATPEQVYDRGAEIARAHYAHWREQPVVVQHIIDRSPAGFDVPVPTPRGKQPVYPRMVFLRREVLHPGQRPAPTPTPPVEAGVGADEELLSAPEPWLLGIHPPPQPPPRATHTMTLQPTALLYASKDGQVFRHQFIKWLKDNSNAWILLCNFDRRELPALADLVSAQLVFYVYEAHDKAPMQAAAVSLKAPFQPGRPFDFAYLGRLIGATVVPRGRGPGAPFDPPRRCEIDVTREVRRWLRGADALGFALRIVPNRAIDDGWTVRFTPQPDRPVELELQVASS